MKPLFTVHAGEYLVGSYIETHYPQWNIWLPSKDTGIDLLVTNVGRTAAVSIQVKFSKDFNPTNRSNLAQPKLAAMGWWTHQESKIRNSRADFWVLVLPSFTERGTSFIIIKPKEYLRRLQRIHGRADRRVHSYLQITKSGRCWEGRGLNNSDQEKIAYDRFKNGTRDFTQFLNNWRGIEKQLKD